MSTDFDIVVAGGGIAGLTAGLVAARLGRKTLVLTGDVLGGNLLSIEKIEGYPGFPEGVAGFELCPLTQAQAAEAGVEFETGELIRIDGAAPEWKLTTSDGEFGARAVILATGASLKTLGVPGEEEFKGRGVSHCASCDAPLLRDQVVAVVGGGDSALQEALTLAEAASRVIILEKGPALTAQATYRDRIAENTKIEVRCNVTVEEIIGGDAVEGVRLKDLSGGGEERLEAGGVFVYIGMQPNTAFLDGRLRLAETGGIPTDAAMQTEVEGLFAAGSLRAGWSGRAVASAGEGTTAAISADRYLGGLG